MPSLKEIIFVIDKGKTGEPTMIIVLRNSTHPPKKSKPSAGNIFTNGMGYEINDSVGSETPHPKLIE